MILGIETSCILCSIAWYENEHILLEYNIERNQVHSNVLADLFKDGMNYLNKSANDISLAAISSGPGSFTGLRIGMSFIKGLCFGSDIPIVGVSNFNVLALQACSNEMPLITLINANKGRFYYAKFENKFEDFTEKGILEIDKLNQYSNKKTGLVLDYYTSIDMKDKPWKDFGWIANGRFNASYLCRAAEVKNKINGADDLNDLEPLYLQAFAGVL
jgi:tRNA threonylcarbamoyladenosine biosynthesis protein TsaB